MISVSNSATNEFRINIKVITFTPRVLWISLTAAGPVLMKQVFLCLALREASCDNVIEGYEKYITFNRNCVLKHAHNTKFRCRA